MGFGVLIASARKFSPPPACSTSDFSGLFKAEVAGIFEGKRVSLPPEITADSKANQKVLGTNSARNRWVEIDLSDQRLTAWDGDNLFLETPVSTGLRWYPTPKGEFWIWVKLRYARMEGGQGRYYYNLPNVPYVMYFDNNEIPKWRGYGLHGTYWHNDFGNPRSHGCVNLPTQKAEELFYWLGPLVLDGKPIVYASADNPGSKVVIHD